MSKCPNVPVPCPRCDDEVYTKEMSYEYDPGCWRTSNGDGWPASEEFEVSSWETCTCGFCPDTDATPEELQIMEDTALANLQDLGKDDGPDYEPDDYYRDEDDDPRSLYD